MRFRYFLKDLRNGQYTNHWYLATFTQWRPFTTKGLKEASASAIVFRMIYKIPIKVAKAATEYNTSSVENRITKHRIQLFNNHVMIFNTSNNKIK